ncbi:nuclear transport factor 2 family protein [Novosphingobium sp. Gsoil 351]|nr:nuclear transport factor 2 family protein [Novosphingobium sp. Gsoil 351]
MAGFDAKWKDLPDYIIDITRTIWEGRNVAALREWYAKDIIVRMPGGLSRGNERVIAATLATLAEFPDRTLLADDVVWSGSPEAGMLSSHRISCTATHLGSGVFGPATGRRVGFRAIAECHVRAGVIDDEWLARDQGAICRQIGIEPEEFARAQIIREGGPETAPAPFTPDHDAIGSYTGTGNDDPWGQRYAEILSALMDADIAAVARNYDRACRLAYPDGIEARSHGPAEDFWTGLRAAFPSAEFKIDHRIGNDDPMLGPRGALRWSLQGKHDGWGLFGQPTGAPVYVMGFSHADFGPWGLRSETVVLDTVAIWKQILLHKG